MSFVTARDTEFRLDGDRFMVHGVNCYFLAYCSEESRRAVLSKAKSMGANVVRCWAFLAVDDPLPDQVAFQYFRDGRICGRDGPNGRERLDALIKAAEDFGLKLILPLTNYWPDFGGMQAYVNWLKPGAAITEFYKNDSIRSAYRNWAESLLNRSNTLTGRLYSAEPAIMAWELTNEARCPVQGGREILLDWVTEMAGFVKQHDTNHLLALGDEGFFYKAGRGHLYDGTYGVDWIANLTVSDIDFGTYHMYPQSWGHARNVHFAKRWIEDHITAANRMNKPALLEEFGLKLTDHRADHYARWSQFVEDCGGCGQLVWMLGHAEGGDTKDFVDDYVIY